MDRPTFEVLKAIYGKHLSHEELLKAYNEDETNKHFIAWSILNSSYGKMSTDVHFFDVNSLYPHTRIIGDIGQGKRRTMQRVILHKNGIERQARQCMEECAELIQALNKFLRIAYDGEAPHVDPLDVVTKELADAKNMIEQMILFFENEKEVNEIVQLEVLKEFERVCGTMSEKR